MPPKDRGWVIEKRICYVCRRKKTKSIALKRTGRECVKGPEVGANLGLAAGVFDVGRRRNLCLRHKEVFIHQPQIIESSSWEWEIVCCICIYIYL